MTHHQFLRTVRPLLAKPCSRSAQCLQQKHLGPFPEARTSRRSGRCELCYDKCISFMFTRKISDQQFKIFQQSNLLLSKFSLCSVYGYCELLSNELAAIHVFMLCRLSNPIKIFTNSPRQPELNVQPVLLVDLQAPFSSFVEEVVPKVLVLGESSLLLYQISSFFSVKIDQEP